MVQVLRAAGRVVGLTLQALAGALSALGSGGVVGPGSGPTAPTAKPGEYRP